MAEVDTSSYPKPLPARSLLDTAQQLGGMQQQAMKAAVQYVAVLSARPYLIATRGLI
mgnify:CR=1 FL=1